MYVEDPKYLARTILSEAAIYPGDTGVKRDLMIVISSPCDESGRDIQILAGVQLGEGDKYMFYCRGWEC